MQEPNGRASVEPVDAARVSSWLGGTGEAAARGQHAAQASPSDAASSVQELQTRRERELEAEVQMLKAKLEETAKFAAQPLDLSLHQSSAEWLQVDGFLSELRAMDDKALRETFQTFADIIQEAENSAATDDVSDNAADAEAKEKAAEAETDKRRLSEEGLAKMFETKNITLSKGKLEELMSCIDTDGNGEIDWLEFRAIARSTSDLEMFFKGLPAPLAKHDASTSANLAQRTQEQSMRQIVEQNAALKKELEKANDKLKAKLAATEAAARGQPADASYQRHFEEREMFDGCLQSLRQLDDTSLKAVFNQFADLNGTLYSTFRLVPVDLRRGRECYQVTALRFFDIQGNKIAPASANNPGGSNPVREKPRNLIDDDINSKFLDFNIQPAEFTFTCGVSAMSYEWVTGNDFPGRDMISWRIEGKKFATDTDWTTLHTVSNYDTTLKRKAVVGPFLLCAEAETGNCRLSKQGLAALFAAKNKTLSEGEVEKLMMRIDTDGNGEIDWLEFRALARSNSHLEMFFKGLHLERVLASCFARGAAADSLEAFFSQEHSDVVAGVLKAGHIIEGMIAGHIKKQNEARASQEQAAGGAKYGAELKGGTVEQFFEGVTGICGEPHLGVCVWSV